MFFWTVKVQAVDIFRGMCRSRSRQCGLEALVLSNVNMIVELGCKDTVTHFRYNFVSFSWRLNNKTRVNWGSACYRSIKPAFIISVSIDIQYIYVSTYVCMCVCPSIYFFKIFLKGPGECKASSKYKMG